jgi:hypothetical protein
MIDQCTKHLSPHNSDQLRSEGVNGKHMREPIFGLDSPRFAVSNADVMYDGIERAEPIDLFRDAPSMRDARHVADCGRLSTRNSGQRFCDVFS